MKRLLERIAVALESIAGSLAHIARSQERQSFPLFSTPPAEAKIYEWPKTPTTVKPNDWEQQVQDSMIRAFPRYNPDALVLDPEYGEALRLHNRIYGGPDASSQEDPDKSS